MIILVWQGKNLLIIFKWLKCNNLIMPRDVGPLLGAIDQGTSSTRFLVFSSITGELITYHQIEVTKIYPNCLLYTSPSPRDA